MNSFERRIARIRGRIGPDIPPVVLIWENGERRSMTFLEAVEAISNTPGIVEAVEAISNTPGIVEAEAADATAQSLLSAMLPNGRDFAELVVEE